jgi:hypothetical protein
MELVLKFREAIANNDNYKKELLARRAQHISYNKALDREVIQKLNAFQATAQTLTEQLRDKPAELAAASAQFQQALDLVASHAGDMHGLRWQVACAH